MLEDQPRIIRKNLSHLEKNFPRQFSRITKPPLSIHFLETIATESKKSNKILSSREKFRGDSISARRISGKSYGTILDLLFHLTSTRVGANELWNPLFGTKAPLIAVSNFAISFVFDQPWRHHLRSNVSVTATLTEWNGQLDRGNQVGEGRGWFQRPVGEGARGRACSRDAQERKRPKVARAWG